ncbi:MAG: hypothetical protein ACLFPB_05045 [Desulfovermiculus sp.]
MESHSLAVVGEIPGVIAQALHVLELSYPACAQADELRMIAFSGKKGDRRAGI